MTEQVFWWYREVDQGLGNWEPGRYVQAFCCWRRFVLKGWPTRLLPVTVRVASRFRSWQLIPFRQISTVQNQGSERRELLVYW